MAGNYMDYGQQKPSLASWLVPGVGQGLGILGQLLGGGPSAEEKDNLKLRNDSMRFSNQARPEMYGKLKSMLGGAGQDQMMGNYRNSMAPAYNDALSQGVQHTGLGSPELMTLLNRNRGAQESQFMGDQQQQIMRLLASLVG
jgi:hypothetical protein